MPPRSGQLSDAQLAALEYSGRNQVEAIADKLVPGNDAPQLRAEIGMAPHRVVRRGLLMALAAKLPEIAKPLAADLEILDAGNARPASRHRRPRRRGFAALADTARTIDGVAGEAGKRRLADAGQASPPFQHAA